MIWDEKHLARNIKPTLRALRESTLKMREDQPTDELMGRPRRETKSVDESKNRGEKEMTFQGS